MPRNSVQFQKGMSFNQFSSQYDTEEKCLSALIQWRWPDGFKCPECGNHTHCHLGRSPKLLQCNRCHVQTSVTAGTLFHSTKIALQKWFLAIYLMSQDKKGIPAMKLMRHLGISYNAAWRMKHKIMQAMKEREDQKFLSGFVEVDDAYLGGEYSGGKRGRGSENKTPFIAAIQTDEDYHPQKLKLTLLKTFSTDEIEQWAKAHLKAGSTVISDGLACFNGVEKHHCFHDVIVCGGGKKSVKEPELLWVNTILGNLKTAFRGVFHAVRPKYAQRYLAEFQYRFNRRFDLSTIVARFFYVALRTPAISDRLLKSGN